MQIYCRKSVRQCQCPFRAAAFSTVWNSRSVISTNKNVNALFERLSFLLVSRDHQDQKKFLCQCPYQAAFSTTTKTETLRVVDWCQCPLRAAAFSTMKSETGSAAVHTSVNALIGRQPFLRDNNRNNRRMYWLCQCPNRAAAISTFNAV